jgi:ATP-dependent helicase/nuclease subunit A
MARVQGLRESFMLAPMSASPPVNPSLIATHPQRNATVSASAGSGKTWLLVTRIVRLLLAGAEPGSILALTFTRKAAAQMQLRLQERLLIMATVSDADLVSELEAIDADTDAATLARARELYESLLHALYPVRLCTFHAFCQEILARFPLEADVPPGFELLEDTSQLEQEAWESLFVEATRARDGELASALEVLMIAANGPENTRAGLASLLQHRSDWWAFTENQPQPLAFACAELDARLEFDLARDPVAEFFNDLTRQQVREFAAWLHRHPIATHEKFAAMIDAVTVRAEFDDSAFKIITEVFLTGKGEPRARKSSGAQQTKMGTDGEARFLQLHDQLCAQILHCIDMQLRQQTRRVNAAWYFAGARYIDIFQQLKREQRLLDFTDLEWKCYQLLNTSDNALWVQYKIDQRIDHILIDEFQDTNPTQWQLLLPLLEEMAASDPASRARSVFLVGDEKQSIYAFRRANPLLQQQASDWLQQHLAASETPLSASWRSSPAVIDFVNSVFEQDTLRARMPGYRHHDTHRKQRAGRVQLMPLFAAETSEEIATPATDLRNPLLQPRSQAPAGAHEHEAAWIAQQITALVSTGQFAYRDILILLRNRTHAAPYEEALRSARIPFIGTQRGNLLQNLEIQDMQRLLDVLISGFDNLAIAQVLKSPLFAASDTDLMLLAALPGNLPWLQRLINIAATAHCTPPLARAARLLQRWRARADTVPVHDLLDRIYAEGNLIKRYVASVRADQQQRVRGNLNRFLELSLDIDSGRYPSLTHFLHRLRSLQNQGHAAPDEPVSNAHDGVHMLTIHASKGLEAPVVFLADCNQTNSNNDAHSALVDWPADSPRPRVFQLDMGKRKSDSITAQCQQRKADYAARESLNLLYVAITRACQCLYLSGVTSQRQHDWFELMHAGFSRIAIAQDDGVLTHSFGTLTPQEPAKTRAIAANAAVDDTLHSALRAPLPAQPPRMHMIAPSRAGEAEPSLHRVDEADAKLRGQLIHRALQLLAEQRPAQAQHIHTQLQQEFSAASARELSTWLDEAWRVYTHPHCREVFDTTPVSRCEMPILYEQADVGVYGVIDRIILRDDAIWLIDYKTHRVDAHDTPAINALAASYRTQMQLYQDGVKLLWPGRIVNSALLFTAIARLVWLE